MACCLIAPNHYLNQCWLIIREKCLRYVLRLPPHIPSANELSFGAAHTDAHQSHQEIISKVLLLSHSNQIISHIEDMKTFPSAAPCCLCIQPPMESNLPHQATLDEQDSCYLVHSQVTESCWPQSPRHAGWQGFRALGVSECILNISDISNSQ